MANSIALQMTLAEALDAALVARCMTRDLETNSNSVKYNGGNKFQLAKVAFGDVSNLDYDRNNGFTNGSITLEYEEKEFKKDWGKSFLIDAMDVDETNFIATASLVLNEAERTVFIPALDAFRFAELATLIAANTAQGATVDTYTPAASGALAQIRAAFSTALTDTGLTEQDLICYVSRTMYNALTNDTAVQKIINISGSAIQFNGKIKTIDDVEIHVIDDSRIGTGIHYIVMAKTAPIAIVKHHVTKIITPEENQTADAYRVNLRIYHTLEMRDNQYASTVLGKSSS